jgi:hypothetical protein
VGLAVAKFLKVPSHGVVKIFSRGSIACLYLEVFSVQAQFAASAIRLALYPRRVNIGPFF